MTDTSDPYDGEIYDEIVDENGDPILPSVGLDELIARLTGEDRDT